MVDEVAASSAEPREHPEPAAPRVARAANRRRGARPNGVVAIRVLDHDKDLARRVGQALGEARAAAVAGAVELPAGRWDGRMAAERVKGGYGLLVLQGLIARDLDGGPALGAELLGSGDLLGMDDGAAERELGLEPRLEVLEPTRVAVLDRAFAIRIAPWPQLSAALAERAHERARRVAIALALAHLPRVEDRIHRLLWHLAERRGRVTPDGIILHLPVTQELLGRLVGARRPTVSLALRGLRERGVVTRSGSDAWVLDLEPPVQAAA
jgi:CRP/FNR family transcriptional regulator, cyclic AMP receptor protein